MKQTGQIKLRLTLNRTIEVIRMTKCGLKCEVFSRIVGYYRPVELWNDGKKEEFKFRKTFSEKKALGSSPEAH
jgi:ribonucleoside-triphosphate reductase